MTKIYHVVACARNRVIGKDNKLPWHFSEDLKHFKKLTLGSTVLMGRKTFESIGKPLPGRENFVVSRTVKHKEGVRFFDSIGNAIGAASTEKTFIIGGAEIYQTTLPYVDGIYLTRIDADYEGDAFYPEVPDEFEEVVIEGLRSENPKIDMVFYERKEKISRKEATGTNEDATA